MSRPALALSVLAVSVLAGASCEEPEPMPLGPSATWLVTSPPVAVGTPFELVIFVRTPLGHRAHAYEVPPLEDLDVVERRILSPTAEGSLSVHREVLLARARTTGLHRWPASEIRVTDASGETYALPLDALELDVPSVLGEGAPPRRPRGYRPAPAAPATRSFGAGFATGAFVAGAAGLLLWRRRRGRGPVEAARPRPLSEGRAHIGGSGRLGRRLDAAREALPGEPERAAAEAALALRHFAADRFLVSTHAHSPEELRSLRPDRATPVEWRAWLDRLADVETARWATRDDAERAVALAEAIDRAVDFCGAVDGPAADDRSSGGSGGSGR